MDKKLKQFYSQQANPRPRMNEDAVKRVKENIFSRLGTVVAEETSVSGWERFSKIFAHAYIVAPLVILLFIAGTAYASANSLPGDALYKVKRGVENARLTLSPTQDAKLRLQMEFAQKRIEELEILQQGLPPQAIEKSDSQENTEVTETNSNNDVSKNVGQVISEQAHARNEARKAINSLQQSQQILESQGKHDKSKEVEQRIEQLDQQLNNASGLLRNNSERSESNSKSNGQNRLNINLDR